MGGGRQVTQGGRESLPLSYQVPQTGGCVSSAFAQPPVLIYGLTVLSSRPGKWQPISCPGVQSKNLPGLLRSGRAALGQPLPATPGLSSGPILALAVQLVSWSSWSALLLDWLDGGRKGWAALAACRKRAGSSGAGGKRLWEGSRLPEPARSCGGRQEQSAGGSVHY